MKQLSLFIFIPAFLLLAGCASTTEQARTDGKLLVVTTTGQIADAARQVGGDLIEVQALMGPGVDPHLYTASEGDVSRLENADIIFYNGLFLEAQMERVLEQLGERKTAVPVAEAIPIEKRLASPIYEDEYDPHIWFDVGLWILVVQEIRDTLIAQDPDNPITYTRNANAYEQKLIDLHAYIQGQVNSVPKEHRVLITAHDAFNYFGRAYGFEVRGLQGVSTATEASTADVQELATFIADNQIPAIFVESSVPVRTVEAVQAAVKAKGFDVAIGGELFSDAMGDEGTPEGTYIGMVRHNIDTIVNALNGRN
ncbi:MAG: zinc ABC transporter substrate-binding protein [Candidatus Promineifilaceae bacterium]